jgi:programmed cell death protein 5
MDDEKREEIRKRKMEELQEQAGGEEQQAAREQAEAKRKALLRQILTPDARERLARVRMARPEVAESLEKQLIALAQQGQVQDKIDESTLKRFLSKLTGSSGRDDINIERR